MLTMPYCVEATPEVYDFYAAKGCIMDPGSPREMWDGSVGVIIYGRSTEKNKAPGAATGEVDRVSWKAQALHACREMARGAVQVYSE